MGIFLIVIGLALVIGIIISIVEDRKSYSFLEKFIRGSIENIPVVALILFALYGLVSTLSIVDSYNSYLEARCLYDGVVEQYRDAVVLYEEKAVVIDINKVANITFTDMKYDGYQKQMAEFIKELRDKVTTYNIIYTKKKLRAKNFFYSWYIVELDSDMKLMRIIEPKKVTT